jgi:hypothetical protein
MFDEFTWKECRVVPALTTFCDGLQKALRSGNLAGCAQTGEGESICRAYMNLDASLCRLGGKLGDVEFDAPGKKEGEPAKVKVKDVAVESCKKHIESRKFLAKGLKALAESGPPRERELAKAALQHPDACETYAQAALRACEGTAPTPAPAGAEPKGPAPAAPGAAPQGALQPPGDPKGAPGNASG